jgi:hypothetical protein
MIRMKVRCEKCGTEGQLQHIGKNYYRVKHYLGSVNGKLRFEYHRQSLEYISNILDIGKKRKPIDPIDQKNIDLKLNDLSLFRCEGWDSNPRRPSPEDLKSSPLSWALFWAPI